MQCETERIIVGGLAIGLVPFEVSSVLGNCVHISEGGVGVW